MQVAAHLFQAGANIVKLGIQKTRGSSPDKYLGVYWPYINYYRDSSYAKQTRKVDKYAGKHGDKAQHKDNCGEEQKW